MNSSSFCKPAFIPDFLWRELPVVKWSLSYHPPHRWSLFLCAISFLWCFWEALPLSLKSSCVTVIYYSAEQDYSFTAGQKEERSYARKVLISETIRTTDNCCCVYSGHHFVLCRQLMALYHSNNSQSILQDYFILMVTAAKVLTLYEEPLYSPQIKNPLKININFKEIFYVFSTLNRSIWHLLTNLFIFYTNFSSSVLVC